MILPVPEKLRTALPSVLLCGGFLTDVLTFRTLKPSTTFLLLGAYALAAGGGILMGERGAGPLRKAVPVVLQFVFGALLSSAFLFYWFGGSVAASWPVMLATVLLMASNEAFRNAFLQPTVQFGVFAFVLYSYCTLLFPFLFRSVSAWVFVLGGVAATAFTFGLGELIARTDATRVPLRRRFRGIALGTFAAFNALYFLNVIPPVPLSIRQAGIYHHVERKAGDYALQGEPENFLQRLWPGQTLHADADGRVYAFTAIYAPTDLDTVIVHRWERYDEAAARWKDAGKSQYAMTGGREDGYRGYSYRSVPSPGRWRVIIESARGQELGRIGFRVVD